MAGDGLSDGVLEKAVGLGCSEEINDGRSTGGLTEYGHVVGVSAKGSDVFLDPFERFNLVSELSVSGNGRVIEAQVAEDVDPVVYGD